MMRVIEVIFRLCQAACDRVSVGANEWVEVGPEQFASVSVGRKWRSFYGDINFVGLLGQLNPVGTRFGAEAHVVVARGACGQIGFDPSKTGVVSGLADLGVDFGSTV
jgi:hypothetical protein